MLFSFATGQKSYTAKWEIMLFNIIQWFSVVCCCGSCKSSTICTFHLQSVLSGQNWLDWRENHVWITCQKLRKQREPGPGRGSATAAEGLREKGIEFGVYRSPGKDPGVFPDLWQRGQRLHNTHWYEGELSFSFPFSILVILVHSFKICLWTSLVCVHIQNVFKMIQSKLRCNRLRKAYRQSCPNLRIRLHSFSSVNLFIMLLLLRFWPLQTFYIVGKSCLLMVLLSLAVPSAGY